MVDLAVPCEDLLALVAAGEVVDGPGGGGRDGEGVVGVGEGCSQSNAQKGKDE